MSGSINVMLWHFTLFPPLQSQLTIVRTYLSTIDKYSNYSLLPLEEGIMWNVAPRHLWNRSNELYWRMWSTEVIISGATVYSLQATPTSDGQIQIVLTHAEDLGREFSILKECNSKLDRVYIFESCLLDACVKVWSWTVNGFILIAVRKLCNW